MRNRHWLLYAGAAAGLALVLADAALADPPPPTSTEPADPPGTTPYMDRLRAVFAAWDLDGDQYLDKPELAKAFRGPDARPYDSKQAADPAVKEPSTDPAATKKPDSTQYPDYEFLIQLDQDGDGRISRTEFMSWARDYAVQRKEQADQETKVAAVQAKLLTASSPKAVKELEKELKKEQASLAKMSKNMNKAAKAAEKAMEPQAKPKK
jgi:Ca2+-binding EF-hand superfamily protein